MKARRPVSRRICSGSWTALSERRAIRPPMGTSRSRRSRAFLRSTDQRLVRSSAGWLHTHFFDGTTTVPEFLREAAGGAIDGLYLEVISPYFDAGPESEPLSDLIAAFGPKEVRVFLPRKDTGEALCSAELFEWVRSQPDVSWGRLPKDVTRGGKSDEVKSRTVHAKVYRFFQANPKREYLFVGSVNLTGPAHHKGGNLETGFFVELEPARRPDWWLEADRHEACDLSSREARTRAPQHCRFEAVAAVLVGLETGGSVLGQRRDITAASGLSERGAALSVGAAAAEAVGTSKRPERVDQWSGSSTPPPFSWSKAIARSQLPFWFRRRVWHSGRHCCSIYRRPRSCATGRC